MKLRLCLLAALVTVACKAQGPNYCDTSTPCLDNQLYCDLDGTLQPLRNQCVDLRAVSIACPDGGGCPEPLGICSMGKCVGCLKRSDCTVPQRPVCEPTGVCGPCTGDADCPGAHCRASDGVCVTCTGPTDCSSNTPVCDMTAGKCRACKADNECTSGVCGSDGSCVAESAVVFVDGAVAASGPNCDRGAACKTIHEGVAKVTAGRTTVHVAPGSYNDALALTGTVSILASGADLSNTTTGKDGVTVSGAATVSIVGLEIHQFAVQTTTGGNGVICSGATPATTHLTLLGVTIDNNGMEGLTANNCTVDVERSRIESNHGGGLRLNASDYDLVNDYVLGNGTSVGTGATTYGGIDLTGMLPSHGRLEYVTATGNLAGVAALASGVLCAQNVFPVTKNSIVYGNVGGAADAGGCSWTFSDIGGSGVATGAGNINAAPMFANPATDNYRLMTTSPCVNTAEMGSTVNIDFDGEPRPMRGTRNDMGADEVP